MLRSSLALLAVLLLPACSGDSGGKASTVVARPRRVVTADWLNRQLTVLDYDKLVAGAATRGDALLDTIDLRSYGAPPDAAADAPGPIEVAVAKDGKTAVVTVGPGFFAGALAPLVGAPNLASTGTALVVDLDTKAVVELDPPSPRPASGAPWAPMGVVITPDGSRALLADHSESSLSIVDLAQKKLVQTVTVGGSPEEVSIAPDGTVGAVNTDGNGSIRFYDPRSPSTTLSTPLAIGADPGGSTFVASEHRVVIAQSLNLPPPAQVGFTVIDVTNPMAATVLENPALPGVPYGADVIPGTSHVLVTSGFASQPPTCALYEIDVSTNPATRTRTIDLPCQAAGLPLSTGVSPDGKTALVGIVGDNSLMVVDLTAGTARRIPWLAAAGPTHAAIVF